MITLDGDVIVLDRTQDGDDILPLTHPGKGTRNDPPAWYIDLGIEDVAVLNLLIDVEVLAEDVAIHYIARDGQLFDAQMGIEELISGPDGNMCRLSGHGKPPAAFLADEPKMV